jgi:hypothetical protein
MSDSCFIFEFSATFNVFSDYCWSSVLMEKPVCHVGNYTTGMTHFSFPCSTTLGCVTPLGMESGDIADAQKRASSILDGNSSPGQARLHQKADGSRAGGWSALKDDLNQWLQVDLGSYTTVTRVATQGRNGHYDWVTRYKIEYGNDGVNFHFYQEPGDSSPKVSFLLASGVCDSVMVAYRMSYIHGLFLRRTKLHTRKPQKYKNT